MLISNENIYQADYETVEAWRGESGANVEENRKQIHKVIIPKEFEGDIEAIVAYTGLPRIERGTVIRLTLTELLSIIPKARRRIDSYGSLVKYLADEMDVTLIITSRKTKTHD